MDPDDASGDRTLTFLFTDIEDSTGHWQRSPGAMRRAIARHDDLLRERFEAYGGHVFKTVGDAFCVAYPNAPAALAAAIDAQRAVTAAFSADDAPLPLRVRIALHTGDVQTVDDDYRGVTLSHVSRALGLAHGGQILLTAETHLLSRAALPEGASVRDLGEYKLRGFDRPARLYQLRHPDLPDDFPPLKSAANIPHNLPRSLTPFIGRERDIAEVRRRLGEYPLVTLTGPGGSGKTRLAVEIGEALLTDFPDGVYFVDLAPRTEGHLVREAVRAALRARPDAAAASGDSITDQLRDKRILLILDNCEHLVDACAQLAEELLQEVETLRILATSRESLGIGGETVWPVPGLPLPDSRRPLTPRRLLQSEAARLFVERAAAAAPSFAVTKENAGHIADICQRLDGLPLALTIAAAWAGTLNPQQIADRLKDRFRFLRASTNRTAATRQQTLRATIEWSYNLLSDSEQALFRRLSVFVGGWTLEAAEAVCDGAPVDDVLTDLFALARKSLVLTKNGVSGTRYYVLETIREYALEQLLSSDEEETLTQLHLRHFITLSVAAETGLKGKDQEKWLRILDEEYNNIFNALHRESNTEDRLRLAINVHRYWLIRGYTQTGYNILSGIVKLMSAQGCIVSPYEIARANNIMGILSWYNGNINDARKFFEDAINDRDAVSDQLLASVLTNLGILCSQEGDLDLAFERVSESVAIYRSTNEITALGMALSNLGGICLDQQDYEKAKIALQESLAYQREVADAFALANTLHNLGEAYRKSNDCTTAMLYFREAASQRSKINDNTGLIQTLISAASCLSLQNKEWSRDLINAVRKYKSENAIVLPARIQQEEEYLRSELSGNQKEASFEDVPYSTISLSQLLNLAFDSIHDI